MTLRGAMEELSAHRRDNPRLDMWLEMVQALEEHAFGGTDHDACIAAFNAHNRRVQEDVPADRLLVFRVQDGWESLCEFLGREVPNEPFPHLNEGADTVRAGLALAFGLTPS
jgi:hypothetical protein